MKRGDRVIVKLLFYGDGTSARNVEGYIAYSGGRGLWWVKTNTGRLGWVKEEDIEDARSTTSS